MKLQLFRYILTPTQFRIGESSKPLTKKGIMLNLMDKNFDLQIQGKEFLYREVTRVGDDIIVANIGKLSLKAHDKKINDKFVKQKEEEWPHRNFFKHKRANTACSI